MRPVLAFWAALMPAAALAQGLPYAIVHTNQTQCYDQDGRIDCPAPGQPFRGQDGNHATIRPSYRDNGDGTVSDLVTGLMWQRDFVRTGFFQAFDLAAASRVGGYADWRVPSVKELYSLMDFSGATGSARPESQSVPGDARPYLDSRVFSFEYPAFPRYIDAQYVTGTVYQGITMGRDRAFFGVNFADGRIKAYPQDGGPGRKVWYGRFVRGNPAYGKNDFVDQGDGTILDRATGLTWTKADSGDRQWRGTGDGRLDWKQALAFCQGLNHAGHADWRLPHAKELQSIVDYSRSPGTSQSAALDPIFSITPIREADGQRNWPYFWTGTTHLDGRRPGEFAVYVAFGMAMGNLGAGGMMGPPPGMGAGFTLTDVHGAGAQRSSPKSGDERMLPVGAGPQGDVLRIYNYARCVRG